MCGIDKPLGFEYFSDHAARSNKVMKGFIRDPLEYGKQNEQKNKGFKCTENSAENHINKSEWRNAVHDCAAETTQEPTTEFDGDQKQNKTKCHHDPLPERFAHGIVQRGGRAEIPL